MRFLIFLLLFSIFPKSTFAAVDPVVIKTQTEVVGGGLSVSGSSVTVLNTFIIITFDINVSTGTGFTVFSSTGTLNQCSVNPPNSITKFSFDIFTNDADEFAIMGAASMFGKMSLSANRFLLGEYKAKITDASIDGIYKTRCIIEK